MTKRKRRHRRSVDVRINWLQPHADGFKDRLVKRKYTPATITEVVRLLALWDDWVRAAGFEIETLAVGFAASASVFRGSKIARAPQGAAALFIAHLRERNVLPLEHAVTGGDLAGTGSLPLLDAGAARHQGLHARHLPGDPRSC